MILQVTASNAAEESFAAEHERLFKEIWGRIAKAGISRMVLLAAREELQRLLRRESDGIARDKAMALIESYFASIAILPARPAAQSLKGFVELVTRIVLAARLRALAEQYEQYRLAAAFNAKTPKNAICWSLAGRSPSRRF